MWVPAAPPTWRMRVDELHAGRSGQVGVERDQVGPLGRPATQTLLAPSAAITISCPSRRSMLPSWTLDRWLSGDDEDARGHGSPL